MNKEDTLRVSVKGTYGHNFYVPMVTIHNTLCRKYKKKYKTGRNWGHWDTGTHGSNDPSVWMTTSELSLKPMFFGNKGQLTQGYSLGTVITFGW